MNKVGKIYKQLKTNRLFKLLGYEDFGDQDCPKPYLELEDVITGEVVYEKYFFNEDLIEENCPVAQLLYEVKK